MTKLTLSCAHAAIKAHSTDPTHPGPDVETPSDPYSESTTLGYGMFI